MPRILFKILTFILILSAFIAQSWSQTMTQDELKTHLRWTLKTPKEQVSIIKKDNTIFIETLSEDLFQKIVEDLVKFENSPSYINKMEYKKEDFPNRPAIIEVSLKDKSVELFSFYKEDEQKFIMDFWINKDVVATQKAALEKKPISPVKKEVSKVIATKNIAKKVEVKKNDPEKVIENQNTKDFRDFRYGAAFVWNYSSYIPPLKNDLNIEIKAPDFLYQVKDRDYESDPKEAHMQLSIKFFRQRNWGLMTKSISLYETKYGMDSNRDINDFMKATSLIKNTIKEEIKPASKEEIKAADDPNTVGLMSKTSTMFSAINLLGNVAERTIDFDLKQASLRYILQYYLDKKDFVKSLQIAKNLYVAAAENFNDETIIYSSKVILHSLAKLKQLDKINEFLENKAVIRVLPAQEGLAYKSYVELENEQLDLLISDFEKNESSFAKPIHPSIVYNTAEAYFRNADYEKAIKLYDNFILNYSELEISGHARLRLALSYDLLDKDLKQVLTLYENAINRSVDPVITYESKIRYVGLAVARRKILSKKDIEVLAFLEKNPLEKKSMTPDLKKTLWLVRLRSFISQEKYDDALAYLSTIPMENLNLVDKRTFDGDGAEIIVGLIKKLYLEEDYSKAVKVWELYKDKYETKVAKSPYLNFIVCDSFLKTGLYSSFDRAFNILKNTQNTKIRTFPRWVEAHKNLDVDNYIKELELIKYFGRQEWSNVDNFLESLNDEDKKNLNYNFYKGVVAYHLKNYNNSIENFEKILVSPNEHNVLSPGQTAMMLLDYTESLYQLGNHERFRKNALALIGDLKQSNKKVYLSTRERIEYLLIESFSSDKDANYLQIENRAQDYLKDFEQSNYNHRVRYLYGLALVKNQKEEEGKNVLNELINNEQTPSYLKGLARSELSSLVIKNKTL